MSYNQQPIENRMKVIQAEFLPTVKISVSIEQKGIERAQITNSQEAFDVIKRLFDQGQIEWVESFYAIALNRANAVIGCWQVSHGGMNACIVDVRPLFMTALNVLASRIIVAHNHPSGNLKASSEDYTITERIVECGKLLEIPLLDHLIITKDDYYSFADNGTL